MSEKLEPLPFRYIAADPTEQQREDVRDFYNEHGDCKLIWVNEGDLLDMLFNTRTPSPPALDDVVGACRSALGGLSQLEETRLREALASFQPNKAVSGDAVHVVFSGPPGPSGGRFIECETPNGCSINAGDWNERDDGLWELQIPLASLPATDTDEAMVERVGTAICEALWERRQLRISEEAADALALAAINLARGVK